MHTDKAYSKTKDLLKNILEVKRVSESGVGKMAQQLRTDAILAENPGLVSGTHMTLHDYLKL